MEQTGCYKIHVVFGQRKCKYPGEIAPEALACVDEYAFSKNQGLLYSAMTSAVESDMFSHVEIVTVTVPYMLIYDAVNPPKKTTPGTIEPFKA